MFACLHAPGNLALLLECASHFSPLIEETSPDTVVCDVRGLERLIGAPRQIAAAMEHRVGIDASLTIAANPDTAVHAARGFRDITIVAPGREAPTLAPLPLNLLGGSPEFARHLDLWGLRTFGEFAALPPLGVVSRLGEEGAHLQRLAQGAVNRQLKLRVEPMVFCEDRELEDPIEVAESLLFLFSEMLSTLCERLRFHGRATNELRLRMKLERAAGYTATLRLPVPMLNAKVLLKLLQLEINARPPEAPVERVYLELMPAEPRTAQHGLFLPVSPEPEKLEITLARIRGLVGAENVGAPELLDTHRPDAFRMTQLAHSKDGAPSPRPKLAFRRFRPPRPASVWCSPQGHPVRVFSRGMGGLVLAYAGPWRSTGNWWTPDAWSRQEWDIEIAKVGLFRLSRDCVQDRWLLDGNYD